jgi:hypothetical protein
MIRYTEDTRRKTLREKRVRHLHNKEEEVEKSDASEATSVSSSHHVK